MRNQPIKRHQSTFRPLSRDHQFTAYCSAGDSIWINAKYWCPPNEKRIGILVLEKLIWSLFCRREANSFPIFGKWKWLIYQALANMKSWKPVSNRNMEFMSFWFISVALEKNYLDLKSEYLSTQIQEVGNYWKRNLAAFGKAQLRGSRQRVEWAAWSIGMKN